MSSSVKLPLALGVLFGLAGLSSAPASAADGGKGMAYVSNQKGNVSVTDLDTLEAVSEIDVGAEGPRGIGVTSDGKFLVTANGEDGDISVIDRVSGRLVKRIPIGKNPEFVRIRGDHAFVSFEPAAYRPARCLTGSPSTARASGCSWRWPGARRCRCSTPRPMSRSGLGASRQALG